MKVWIPGNVPSSKNSKQWTGKRLISSKLVLKYEKDREWDYVANKAKFREMIKGFDPPYIIKYELVRDSRRRFDYHNIIQLPADLMVKHGWLKDDNADVVKFVPAGYSVSKTAPGILFYM